MDLRYLETFVAVVEAGSIAEAARQMDAAPTTVAQQIRALEQSLGSPLLSRSGRTVRPTVAGTRIVSRCREIVDSMRDLRSEASGTDLPAGPLRLGATPSALTGMIPPVLRAWNKLHEQVEIYIVPGTSSVLLSNVMSGELDAAVMVHPTFALSKACVWLPLRHESLVLLTQAKMKGDDPMAIIEREPFIRYDRSVVAGKMADDYLRQRHLRPKVQFELDGLDHIAKFVSEGLGVSIVPDWPIIGAHDPTLRRLPLPEPCPSRTVGMVWLRSSVRSPLAQAFADLASGLLGSKSSIQKKASRS